MIKENNASEAKDEQQNKYYHICHVCQIQTHLIVFGAIHCSTS